MGQDPEPEIERAPEMQDYLDQFRREIFGRDGKDGRCVTCGSESTKPEDFRDEVSRREYQISRMCQVCQDGVFGV